MTWRKFLSTVLIGGFLFGLPAVNFNFDTPLTKNICAAVSRSEVRNKQREFESARRNLEQARNRYDNATRYKRITRSELRNLRESLDKAIRRYEDAKRNYERALRAYDRGY